MNKYEQLQRKWSILIFSRETFYVTVVLCLNILRLKAVNEITARQTTWQTRTYQIHHEPIKNKTLNSCSWLPQIITDFHNSFADRLNNKFATNSYLNISSHLKCVTTLRCEIWMSQNWQQSEIWIMINDIWQGSISSIWVMMRYFITNVWFNLLVKEFLKSVNTWQSYRQNGWLRHTPHVPHSP